MKELSALPLFAKVVELSSFAEAARQLNVPTTTVSRKIQQLEHDLGGKLLNRSTRSLSLTELGIQVLPKAIWQSWYDQRNGTVFLTDCASKTECD